MTPRRFNLVGLRWRGRAAPRRGAARAAPRPRLEPLGAARHARAAGASDPLWVGSGDAVQYRLSRPVRGLRLHFVNVASELRARRRARAAQEPEPDFVTRAEWGASACPPRTAPDYGSVKAVHVHHTVSLNDYSPEESAAIVLAICRYHRNSNGWNDIGYKALVDKYGVLFEGRAGGLDQAVIGAQAQGFNAETAGIASIADHTSAEATPETMAALARYIRWKLGVHGQPLSGTVTLTSAGGSASRYPAGARVTVERVIGHRDTGQTACPGALLYPASTSCARWWSPAWRGVPSFATRLSATLADFTRRQRRARAPERLALRSRRRPARGRAGGGADQRRRRLAHVLARGDRRRRRLRRRAAPAQARLRAAALPGALGPAARHLAATAAAGARGDRAAAPASARSSGPARARDGQPGAAQAGAEARAAAARARALSQGGGANGCRCARGRFRASFVPAFSDSYRYALIAPGDDDTDRGSSGWISLRVRR